MSIETIIEISVAGAYVINNVVLPSILTISDLAKSEVSFRSKKPMIRSIDIVGIVSGKDDFDLALQYLKTAHTKFNKDMLSNEVIQGSNEWLCNRSAPEVYANFISLVESHDLGRLKDYVRIAYGTAKIYNKPRAGHAWLEIKQGNKWVPYETTSLGRDSTRLSITHVEQNMPNEIVLADPRDKYFRVYSAQETYERKLKIRIPIHNLLTGWHSGMIQVIYYSSRLRDKH